MSRHEFTLPLPAVGDDTTVSDLVAELNVQIRERVDRMLTEYPPGTRAEHPTTSLRNGEAVVSVQIIPPEDKRWPPPGLETK